MQINPSARTWQTGGVHQPTFGGFRKKTGNEPLDEVVIRQLNQKPETEGEAIVRQKLKKNWKKVQSSSWRTATTSMAGGIGVPTTLIATAPDDPNMPWNLYEAVTSIPATATLGVVAGLLLGLGLKKYHTRQLIKKLQRSPNVNNTKANE